MFGYAAYYYGAHLQDEAFDVLQAGLFFGYMALVALGVLVICSRCQSTGPRQSRFSALLLLNPIPCFLVP